MHELILNSDVALGPGRSALEAMNCARPVVPLGSGGCQGLVTTECFADCAYSNFGGAFSRINQDASTVLGDLISLLEPGRARSIGKDLQSLVRRDFNVDVHHKRLMKFYVKAVRDNRHS